MGGLDMKYMGTYTYGYTGIHGDTRGYIDYILILTLNQLVSK